jgi:hypothetical protein
MDPLTGMLIFGGLNAGMGAMKAAEAKKQREQEMRMRAAEIEASPWTGRGPSTQVSTPSLNPWAEMAGGAINAAGQVAALQNAGLFKPEDMSDEAIKNIANTTQVTGSGGNLSLTRLSPYQQSVSQQIYGLQNSSFLNPWEQMTRR